MFLTKCLGVLMVITIVQCNINVTLDVTENLANLENLARNGTSNSSSLDQKPGKRSFLIITAKNGTDILALRQGKKKGTESLLYQEWSDTGDLLNEHWMYNLDNVVDFFRLYHPTEICTGRCEDMQFKKKKCAKADKTKT